MKEELEIIICGDICPTSDTEEFFEKGDTKALFNDVLPILEKADLTIGNLEFPLTDVGDGIIKTGPVLKGKKKYIYVLKEAGFDVLGLANNHIRDCGDEGVLSTFETCAAVDIKNVGAGANLSFAKKPLIYEVKGWKIGIMAFAEQEFNTASDIRAGANYLDVYNDFEQIKEFSNQVDYLMILYHGGIEYYEYPSPELQKKCRKFIECGAALVTCQHSHCIGTKEEYMNGTIVYGQGNTVFGFRKNTPSWNQGLILSVKLTSNGKPKIDYFPIQSSGNGIQLMNDQIAQSLLNQIKERSALTADKEFVQASWLKFCQRQKTTYLPLLFGLNRGLIFLNRKLNNKLITYLYSKKKLNISLNLVRCESHKEVIETILTS